MRRSASRRDIIEIRAPAKVNLTLRVLGRRPDGYHDLESVVAAVGLFDHLHLEPAEKLCLDCDGADIPTGTDNLVMKAAGLLAARTGTDKGARMRLEKSIPAGRGFGGGSSDAAAALKGLNALWGLGLTSEELAQLGAEIGSDVPLFLGPPMSVIRGRGERLSPVTGRPRWWMAVAWPDHGKSTAAVYSAYDRMPQDKTRRPAATDILNHLESSAVDAGECLVNDLEPAYSSLRPEGPNLRAIFEAGGCRAVGMTGSGSAYFALADTEAQATVLADAARVHGAVAGVVRVLNTDGIMGGDIR
jgi:4-diphosphocytidyl-2-C-methyl-D-erythritol kinase